MSTVDLSKMSKEELIQHVQKLEARQGKNRKSEVLELIKQGFDTSAAIADELGITTKNVASVLTALRKDGIHLVTIKVNGENILKMLSEEEAKLFGLA